MAYVATIAACLIFAGIFAALVPLARLFDAFQPLIVALSIMAAATLVRLNRGMPTLDWKSLEHGALTRLTSRIVEISREYLEIIGVLSTLLATLVTLTAVGRDLLVGTATATGWPDFSQKAISAIIGGLTALSVFRMGYVLWRDYDIVRLQKEIIDSASQKTELLRQSAVATEKVTNIRGAALRPVSSADPKPWEG